MAIKNYKYRLGIIWALAGLIFAACTPGATVAPTTTPTSEGSPPPPTGVNQAQIELSEQLGISSEEIVVEEWEAVEWQDSCLGLGQPNESCAQVITPGYRAVLFAEGQDFVAHIDQEGDQVRFENQPFSPEETLPPPEETLSPLSLGEFPLEFYVLVLVKQQWLS